jgi:hypothetical protein
LRGLIYDDPNPTTIPQPPPPDPQPVYQVGFIWRNMVSIPSGFVSDGPSDPYFGYAQTGKVQLKRWENINGVSTLRTLQFSGSEGLDASFPYGNPNSNVPGYAPTRKVGLYSDLIDSPSTPLQWFVGSGKIRDDFSSYLMFNAGGVDDSWVPLKSINWFWAAYWQATPNAVDGTGKPQPYVLASMGSGFVGNVNSAPPFPTWNMNWGPVVNAWVADSTGSTVETWDLPMN